MCQPVLPQFAIDMEADGGAERDRTADLVIANDALSQLDHSYPDQLESLCDESCSG
jgi:hypothetical protein